jgi:hypothetical protein
VSIAQPLPLFERTVAGLAAIACLTAGGWLAHAEFGPEGRYWSASGDDEQSAQGDPLKSARKHLQTRRWEDAIDVLSQVALESVSSAQAGEIRAKALVELRNRGVFNRLQRQAVDNEVDAVRETFRTIPENSAYFPEAKQLVESIK